MGCFQKKVTKDIKESENPIMKIKKKLWRIRNCGLAWMFISLAIFVIGIILLVYFAKYISQDTWKKGVGITGVVFLLLGFLGLAIGVILMVVFCMAFRRSEARMSGKPMTMKSDLHKRRFPAGTYPVQPGFVWPDDPKPVQPAAQPTAPQESAGGQDNKAVDPEEIVVEPTDKY